MRFVLYRMMCMLYRMLSSYLCSYKHGQNIECIVVSIISYCSPQAMFLPLKRVEYTYGRSSANAGVQDLVPSIHTLPFRSTRNKRSNCIPVLAIVFLYCSHQFVVFLC